MVNFSSNAADRALARTKKVRSLSWQGNACRDILGATGLWPSLTGLKKEVYEKIEALIWALQHRQNFAPVDLSRGRNALEFGTVLAELQGRLDEAAHAAGSDSAEVSLRWKAEKQYHRDVLYRPEVVVTTVTSGTEFIFGVSNAKIDFGEVGSTFRAYGALRGLHKAHCSSGRLVYTDGSADNSGYLTREAFEEQYPSNE